MPGLLACPDCGSTNFLEAQHGWIYWGTTFSAEGYADHSHHPDEYGDAETHGYECCDCDFSFDGAEDLVPAG